jgi:ferrous iron transport protein A
MPSNLEHAELRFPLRIAGIDGGHEVRARLATMGLLPGVVLSVLNRGPLGGPLLVEIDGTRIALGRGVARKVLVEP